MASYKDIVLKASKAIEKCQMGTLLIPAWNSVEWAAHTENHSVSDVALSSADGNVINLYPALFEHTNPEGLLIEEFGKMLLKRLGTRGEALWTKKLDPPTEEAVRQVANKLSDPEVRSQCRRYVDVLSSYPDKGHSVDRLVFINVANALITNNVAFASSAGLNVYTWGATSDYCQGKKYHSLVPLVSAYAPAEVNDCYGAALKSFVLTDLAAVRDKSVAYALRGILQRIARAAIR